MLGGKDPIFILYNGVAWDAATTNAKDFFQNGLDVLSGVSAAGSAALRALSLIPLWFTLENTKTLIHTTCERTVNLAYNIDAQEGSQQVLTNDVTLKMTADKDDLLTKTISALLPFVVKAVLDPTNAPKDPMSNLFGVNSYKMALFYNDIILTNAALVYWKETIDPKTTLKTFEISMTDNPYKDPVSSVLEETLFLTDTANM